MNWFGDEEITRIHTCICSRALSLSRQFWVGAEHTHGTQHTHNTHHAYQTRIHQKKLTLSLSLSLSPSHASKSLQNCHGRCCCSREEAINQHHKNQTHSSTLLASWPSISLSLISVLQLYCLAFAGALAVSHQSPSSIKV
ncbi:hypothetical protein CsSME_00029653 [Camellia sinensis var. sinensis]